MRCSLRRSAGSSDGAIRRKPNFSLVGHPTLAALQVERAALLGELGAQKFAADAPSPEPWADHPRGELPCAAPVGPDLLDAHDGTALLLGHQEPGPPDVARVDGGRADQRLDGLLVGLDGTTDRDQGQDLLPPVDASWRP